MNVWRDWSIYENLKKKLSEIPDEFLIPSLRFFNQMPLWRGSWARSVASFLVQFKKYKFPPPYLVPISQQQHNFSDDELISGGFKRLADEFGTKQHIDIHGRVWECNVFTIPNWEFSKKYFSVLSEQYWKTKGDLYIADDGYIIHKLQIIGEYDFYLYCILQNMECFGSQKRLQGGYRWKCEADSNFWDFYKELKPFMDHGFFKLVEIKNIKYLIRITKTNNILEDVPIKHVKIDY
jgi:hypothetical protein